MKNPINVGFLYGIFSLIYNSIVDAMLGGKKMHLYFKETILLMKKKKQHLSKIQLSYY